MTAITESLFTETMGDVPEAIAGNPVALEIYEQQQELVGPTERAMLFRSVVPETPLLRVAPELLPEAQGYDVLVKYDGALSGGAYKLRGATNALMRAREERPDTHTATVASTGNMANTLIIAARALGVPAVRVMCPYDTSPAKLAAMQENGAAEGFSLEINTSFDTLPEALAAAQAAGEENGVAYIDPFNAEATIAGQGTAMQEVVRSLREDTRFVGTAKVFAPVGGGGYLAGNAVAAYGSGITMIGSQMKGCEGAVAALRGERLDPAKIDKSCDGAAVAVPGDKPMSVIRDQRLVSEVRVVAKHEVARAMRLLSHVHEHPEPAGALAFAAMLQYVREHPAPNDGRRHILIPFTSGINATPAKLSEFAQAEFQYLSDTYAARTVHGLPEALQLTASPQTAAARRRQIGRVLLNAA